MSQFGASRDVDAVASSGVSRPVIHFSQLVRRPVVARSGEVVGRVEDVIVGLRGADTYPVVTGLVVGVGGRQVYVSAKQVQDCQRRAKIDPFVPVEY